MYTTALAFALVLALNISSAIYIYILYNYIERLHVSKPERLRLGNTSG